uniref:UBZ4-type domain-containing protein n=1 Tax=Timema shepardi TaxID=629360 RepID=A0A7R9G4K4_TIMSH|nr:unnamed protein product [Timema shepardi]
MKSFQPHLENDHSAKGVSKGSDENNKSTILIENETKNEQLFSSTQKNQSNHVSNRLCTPKAKTSKNVTNSQLKSPVFKSSIPRDHSASKNLNSLFENEIMPSTSTSKNIQLPSQLQDKEQTPIKEIVIPSLFSPKKSTKPKELIKLKCPVCSVDIPEHHINTHLDSCLKEPDRFTVLYNSECDSLRPCPVAELVQQLEREEKEERDSVSTSSSHNIGERQEKGGEGIVLDRPWNTVALCGTFHYGDSPLRMPGQASRRSECHASESLSFLPGRDSECSSLCESCQEVNARQQRKNTVLKKKVEDADDPSILIHLADGDKDSENIQTDRLTRRKRRRILDSDDDDDDDDSVGKSRVTLGQKTSSDLSVRSSLVDNKPTIETIELSDEDMFDEDIFDEDMFDEDTKDDTDFEEGMNHTKVKSEPNINETSQSIDYIPLGQVIKEECSPDRQDSDSESNKSISLLLLNHDEDSLLGQHMQSQINGPVIVKPINIKEELGLFDNTLDESDFSKIVPVENELLVDQHSSRGASHESLSLNLSVPIDSQLDDPDFEVELEELLQDSSEESVKKITAKKTNKKSIKMPTRVLRKRTKR